MFCCLFVFSTKTIQKSSNAIKKYFPVVLFIMLHKVVLTSESVDEIPKFTTIQKKATEQHFPVLLFIMLYEVVLTFKSVDKNRKL